MKKILVDYRKMFKVGDAVWIEQQDPRPLNIRTEQIIARVKDLKRDDVLVRTSDGQEAWLSHIRGPHSKEDGYKKEALIGKCDIDTYINDLEHRLRNEMDTNRALNARVDRLEDQIKEYEEENNKSFFDKLFN